MKHWLTVSVVCTAVLSVVAAVEAAGPTPLDQAIARENQAAGLNLKPAPVINDLAFLRRATVDIIGRIPSDAEIQEYLAWPVDVRREKLVDKLLVDARFADRWTTFLGDMLRLRSNAEGGATLTAYVHKAVEDGMPYDELCRSLIAASGKSGTVAEVGFILSDNADPMALTGITSQVFLGVRMACAECHDHPFDVWTREDFYGLASYFGKTRRIERRFNDRILATYTTEVDETTVLWPPEGVAPASERKPMQARFPVALVEESPNLQYIARLRALREAKKVEVAKVEAAPAGPSVDDLLTAASDAVEKRTAGQVDAGLGVLEEARRDVKQLKTGGAAYRPSELREELANLIANPRNRYFSRSFVNRVWAELVGTPFVDPIDDFSAENEVSHPETLDFIADEFVANGYDLRNLIRMIAASEAYQRSHADGVSDQERVDLEAAMLAVPVRRMLSESIYDSIVLAGHLFGVKHEAGKNLKTVWRATQVMKPTVAVAKKKPESKLDPAALIAGGTASMPAPAMDGNKQPVGKGYDLEKAIEVDFNAVLAAKGNDGGVMLEKMVAKSAEELEAERMAEESQRQRAEYFDRYVKDIIDDNPSFSSAFRMAAPAAPEHFLRVFGQPGRQELGDFRDHSSSMRQQLMVLNGSLTHEAARVGELEPMYKLLVGKQANVAAAIRLAYREVLTREPEEAELAEAQSLLADSGSPLDGIADLRWVLLNSNEFRFIP